MLIANILSKKVSFKEKSVLINKYESLEQTDPSSPEYFKYISYFNTIIQLPFGKYHNLSIANPINFLKESQSILNNVIYGNFEAKSTNQKRAFLVTLITPSTKQ